MEDIYTQHPVNLRKMSFIIIIIIIQLTYVRAWQQENKANYGQALKTAVPKNEQYNQI
jgi:hypothetical protein